MPGRHVEPGVRRSAGRVTGGMNERAIMSPRTGARACCVRAGPDARRHDGDWTYRVRGRAWRRAWCWGSVMSVAVARWPLSSAFGPQPRRRPCRRRRRSSILVEGGARERARPGEGRDLRARRAAIRACTPTSSRTSASSSTAARSCSSIPTASRRRWSCAPGGVGFRDANVTHEAINPGKTPVRVIEVELK